MTTQSKLDVKSMKNKITLVFNAFGLIAGIRFLLSGIFKIHSSNDLFGLDAVLGTCQVNLACTIFLAFYIVKAARRGHSRQS